MQVHKHAHAQRLSCLRACMCLFARVWCGPWVPGWVLAPSHSRPTPTPKTHTGGQFPCSTLAFATVQYKGNVLMGHHLFYIADNALQDNTMHGVCSKLQSLWLWNCTIYALSHLAPPTSTALYKILRHEGPDPDIHRDHWTIILDKGEELDELICAQFTVVTIHIHTSHNL